MPTKHILAILATWRLTEILISENAPFDIALKAREIAEREGVKVVYDYNGNHKIAQRIAKNKWYFELYKALSCRYCMSVQVGIAIAIVTRVNPLWGFAYSAGSLLFDKLFEAIPQKKLQVDYEVE